MVRLFNIDLHISVIAEVKDIFKRINTNIEIDDWLLSGHAWVLNRHTTSIDIINSNSWRSMDMDLIEKFINKYDDIFKLFDGFICCYPISFAMIFERYNKPIFIINCMRYDMPFCMNNNHSMIKNLHKCLINLQNKNLLKFISNNKADDAYVKLGIPTLSTKIIPSLCLYTNMSWNPANTNNKFLLYTGSLPFENNNIIYRSSIGNFTWDSLMYFNGIIHLPYEASTMSIFEHISSEIPLLFPTRRFLKYLWDNNLIRNQMNYWKHNNDTVIPNYLQETSNNHFWIENADYYDITGYYYFDSFEELNNMVCNFKDVHYDIRKEFIKERKENILKQYTESVSLLLTLN
jgi:hypothetical protein